MLRRFREIFVTGFPKGLTFILILQQISISVFKGYFKTGPEVQRNEIGNKKIATLTTLLIITTL
jgi:hypothetical protein